MAEITQQRQQELLEDYAQLKLTINQIDEKYSLSYIEVQLDLPPTLGLEPLQFVPKTQAELVQEAEQSIAAKYEEKSRNLEKSHLAAIANLQYQQQRLQQKLQQQLQELATNCDQKMLDANRKMADNGLLFSDIAAKAQSNGQADYADGEQELQQQYQQQLQALADKQTALQQSYQQSVESLEEQRQVEKVFVVLELQEKQQKQQQAVEKYNNSLEEKETKYQASCKKALRSAIQAEYQRGLEAARVYAELGESGVHQRILTEKYICCQTTFRLFSREEAQFVMSLDSFLQTHLESSYSAFEEWVNTVLSA